MSASDASLVPTPSGVLPTLGEVVAEKYRIDRMIAEGGMGTVYEATHLQLDEQVAIKFLRSDFAGAMNSELAGRFMREARASAKIKSEHVTRVYDVGTSQSGSPFIVMEKLDGLDLEQLVERDGVLPIAQAIDYVLEACEALAEAHALGIVHRDLKPANLFLTHRADGSSCVKVLDFGISKFKDSGTSGAAMSVTKTHAVMGSPRYMSPEQMRSTKDVDARADVWAIGIILYELFAGTVPFDGESMPQICASILQDEPKPLRTLRPEVTGELDLIVARCLEKKAADRFQNIVPLARELAAFGSPNALASAERVARVLEASPGYVDADSVPRMPIVSNSPSGPIQSIRVSTKPLGTSGIATQVAWTEKPEPALKKRHGVLLAVLGVALFGFAVGVGMSFHHGAPVSGSTTTNAAEAPRTTATDLPATPAGPTITQPAQVASPTTTTPRSTEAAATADDDAAKGSAKKVASPHAPINHPAPHAPKTSVAAVAAPSAPLPSAPAAASTAAPSGNDMWGERK
jgi:serine/threonine protein kinase